MTIEEVIAELEKASEGSRELDGEIAVLCFPDEYAHSDSAHNRRGAHMRVAAFGTFHMGHAPKFTASLDAAMTLVPEGFDWGINDWPSDKGRIGVEAEIWLKPAMQAKDDDRVLCYAPTAPLAICIAALKARSRQP